MPITIALYGPGLAVPSHRAFLVEVMGRHGGYLALMAAIAGGAEAVAIPEVPASVGAVADAVRDVYRRGKARALIVVAEGCAGGSTQLAADLAGDARNACATRRGRRCLAQPHRGRVPRHDCCISGGTVALDDASAG